LFPLAKVALRKTVLCLALGFGLLGGRLAARLRARWNYMKFGERAPTRLERAGIACGRRQRGGGLVRGGGETRDEF
jgi:hypothetical protein